MYGAGSLALAMLGAMACKTKGELAPHPDVTPSRVEARRAGDTTAAAPDLLVVATDLTGRSQVFAVAPGAQAWPAPFATVEHRGDATPRAIALGAEVWLAASEGKRRDRSFDYALFRVGRDGSTERLMGDLTHAGRPLALDGRVLVVRGEAGDPTDDAIRVDRFTLEALDPATGHSQIWHHFEGHHLHLAAAADGEAYLYRVGVEGADVVAVTSGAVRPVRSSVLPFARDFSIDETGRLVFRQRHPDDPRRWRVLRVDAGRLDARLEVLHEGPTFALAPHAWPGGGVVLNPRREGMELRDLAPGHPRLRHPFGPGVDLVRAIAPDRDHVAMLHTVAGQLPVPFVVERRSGRVLTLPPAPDVRVEIAGFAALEEER